jgi:hypothetical protein
MPADVAARVKRAAGRDVSVSEWVTDAVTRKLADEDVTRRFLELCDGLKATPAEKRRADAAVQRVLRSGSRGKTAA